MDHISKDILKGILSHAIFNGLFQVRRVCKLWNSITAEDDLVQDYLDVERIVALMKHFSICPLNHPTIVRIFAYKMDCISTCKDETIIDYDGKAVKKSWTVSHVIYARSPFDVSWDDVRVELINTIRNYFPDRDY